MSIAAEPVAASEPVPNALSKAETFIAAARAAAADGLTWQEFGELSVALMRLLISSYDTVVVMTGAEKKAAVLAAVTLLFDAVADKAVPLVAWPLWIVVRPAVRSLVVALASGAIEQLLPLVRLA